MTELVARDHRSPLATPSGRRAFAAAVGREGPLGRIFLDPALRLAAAKGARSYREQDRYSGIFDQAYFPHALNVSTTAAIVFEAMEKAAGSEPTERDIRIVLAAGALHDANKLPLAERKGLREAVSAPEFSTLLVGFLDEGEIVDVKNLALSVEDGTSRHSSAHPLARLTGRKASRAQIALTLADRLVGSFADPTDPAGYAETVRKFESAHAGVPKIHVRSFTRVPQVALAREARELFLTWIRKSGTLIHETEAYASWIGPEPTEEDLLGLDAALSERLRPEPRDAFRMCGTSNNTIRTSWASAIRADASTVDEWIETLGGPLVVWSGGWGVRNFGTLTSEFPGVFQYDPKPKERVRVELQEEDATRSRAGDSRRAVGKLVIACCIEQFLLKESKTRPPTDPAPFDLEGIDGVMAATVAGILWARDRRDEPGAYEAVLERIAALIEKSEGKPREVLRGLTARVLGATPAPAVTPPTGEACVYCGEAAVDEMEASRAFGIKPTAWAPRKKGVQKESHRGRICPLCFTENQRRDTLLRRYQGGSSDGGYLTAHIHAADLACDIDWIALADLLESDRVHDGKLVLVGKRRKDGQLDGAASQLVPLRGHFSVPVPKPGASGNTSETLATLYKLRDFLAFVHATSFKLHISPLALSPAQERAQFRWTNPPAWMDELGLAEIHVDEIADEATRTGALSVVDALIQAGRAVGGSQGHRTFVSRIARDPLAIYDVPGIRPGQGTKTFIEKLEDRYVTDKEKAGITAIAHTYIRFNARGEWSNNTWTWATRQLLELRDRYQREPDARTLIVGDLLAAAKRKNAGARSQDVEAFVDAMNDYLTQFRGGAAPIGSDQRVLIHAVAYAAKRDYRLIFPKEEPA